MPGAMTILEQHFLEQVPRYLKQIAEELSFIRGFLGNKSTEKDKEEI